MPDNFVDEEVFLKRMRVEDVRLGSVATLLGGALAVTLRVSLMTGIYVSFLFHSVHEQFVIVESTLLCYAAIMALAYALQVHDQSVLESASQAALCVILVTTFSPLLATLTEAYSSDTVFLLATLCGVAHLYLFDYAAHASAVSTQISSAASLNAGFLMSLLLASRLEQTEQVASFLLSAIFLLVMLPDTVLALQLRFPAFGSLLRVALNVALAIANALLLERWSSQALVTAYGTVLGFVSLVSPLILKLLHRYKRVIRGPWDVVSVEELDIDDFLQHHQEGT